MALDLKYFPDPILRVRCKPIEQITPEIRQLAKEMEEKIVELGHCSGLAAPQVGSDLRIFVTLLEEEEGVEPVFEHFINPKIVNPSPEVHTMEEGCMSIPGLWVEVTRPWTVDIEYTNLDGERKTRTVSNIRAKCMMHENDHLNGVLTLDRTTAREKRRVDAKLREMKKKYEDKVLANKRKGR